MFKALFWGTFLSLGVWLGAVGSGVAVTVMSPISATDISSLVSVANVAAPFLGGFAAGWIIKKRGCVYGAWVGVLYSLMGFLLTAMVFPGLFLLNTGSFLLNFSLGCIGGVCGVNLSLYVQKVGRV